MTPDELYALPTRRTVGWRESWGLFEAFFGEPLEAYDVDLEGDGPEVAFHEKLFHAGDGEDTFAVDVMTCAGRPVGLCVRAGRRSEGDAWVTDAALLATAWRGLQAWRRREAPGRLVDGRRDLDVPDGCGGWAVVEVGGVTKAVDADTLAGDGSQVFDEDSLRAAFDATVRPAHGRDGIDATAGLASEATRRLAAAALEASLAPGVGVVERRDGGPGADGWWPLVVSHPTGRHEVGVPSHQAGGTHFSWLAHVRARVVRA